MTKEAKRLYMRDYLRKRRLSAEYRSKAAAATKKWRQNRGAMYRAMIRKKLFDKRNGTLLDLTKAERLPPRTFPRLRSRPTLGE